ncbi:hypothetical protein MANES_14G170001v8 [Manihot esculenta]|uniref:Uncharacterized protein n=1 Tax=Manihot esculenta TaxID=3983 RepID=A0ACB7GHI7_MANES|nr:hypothetical protein MANES_14G170001v8 [Manihot esculenta]
MSCSSCQAPTCCNFCRRSALTSVVHSSSLTSTVAGLPTTCNSLKPDLQDCECCSVQSVNSVIEKLAD